MIKIENAEVVGWEHAIRGMRNPMNSWDKSDSNFNGCWECESDVCSGSDSRFCIGPNNHELMMKLARGGSVHGKYRRMITVYLDVTAPLYWWKEFDTYKVGTVANSCSTMHKIHAKDFVLEDFSCEHLTEVSGDVLNIIIERLNVCRRELLEMNDKLWWWQMIQLLPSSYNQKRTVMLNYEVLTNIYVNRKDHKLDEWREFCEWVESLPYSEFITCDVNK